MKTKQPYWETHEGWDTAGNCLTCGEAGRCRCAHPLKSKPQQHTPTPLEEAQEIISNFFGIPWTGIERAVKAHVFMLTALKLALKSLTGPTVESQKKVNSVITQAIAKADGK